MPRYYFNVLGAKPFNDVVGLELPNISAARDEAVGFASDLMRLNHQRKDWSAWTVRVTDEDHRPAFDLPFQSAAPGG